MIRAVLLLLLLSLFAPAAHALPEDTWIVAIGSNRGDADEGELLYAERDAREIAEVLRTEGRVASDRIRLLQNEPVETVRRVLLEVNALARGALSSGGRQTALLVFYSGHSDAQALHLRGGRLPLDELRGILAGSAAGMRLLIIDACRSGAVTRVKGVVAAPSFTIQLQDRVAAEGLAIITSSTAGESSQESDRLRGSFFTHHLVNALRGAADRNNDGRITLSEAYAYTYEQTLRSSGQTLALQHPTYAFDVRGSGELVLTSPLRPQGGMGRLRLSGADTYLISEGGPGGSLVAELVPPRPRALLALPPAQYFVQQRRPDEFREYQLRLQAEAEMDLERLPYRPVRYDQLVRKRGGRRDRVHGLTALVGLRGEMIAGEGVTPQLFVGYQADLPWLTVGARVRGLFSAGNGVDQDLPRRHGELGVGLLLQRFIDLPWLSLSLGLSIEGVWHLQSFDSTVRGVPLRQGLGLGFGGALGLERHLFRGLAVRVEGGPVTLLYRQAIVQGGAEVGAATAAAFTGSAAAGIVGRL